MEQVLIPILTALIGVYIGHRLTISGEQWKEKSKAISKFSGSLRKTLPEIKAGLENVYLFNTDLADYNSILKDNEFELGYIKLPDKVKTQIKETAESANEFVIEFRRLSKHVLSYFESMQNRVGQGAEKIDTIVATKLLCLDRQDIPTEKTVINFPRDSRSHFTQVQCQPNQLVEIWQLGEQGNSRLLCEKRMLALSNIEKLDAILRK